ncbi:MAG: hypothetical protein AB4058_18945 [Microcystaceae cyanobacterium]
MSLDVSQIGDDLGQMNAWMKLLPWGIAASAAWLLGFTYNTRIEGKIGLLTKMYGEKTVLAAEKQGERRIILVGGSGVHYSVNSQKLEEKLGIPVFNFGLDGNLGFNVIFPAVLPNIRAGDIVLLIPEYLMLTDDDGIGMRSVFFEAATQQVGKADIPLRTYTEDGFSLGVASLRPLVKTSLDLATKGHIDNYYSDPLTPWGDPTKTWGRKSAWWKLPIRKPVTPHSVQRIRQFRDQLAAKNAELVIAIPWIYGSTDEKTWKNVQTTADKLSEIAPTLYDPDSLNIQTDVSLFADTHYHLIPEGRLLRTEQIVQEITPLLEKDN